jgi:hypothetical protein
VKCQLSGRRILGVKRSQLRAGTDYRSWQEADLLTYFCNVCFWGAKMPPFATGMGAKRTYSRAIVQVPHMARSGSKLRVRL